MADMKPWHMARVASRRELPKPRKMHGPVGEKLETPDEGRARYPKMKSIWFAPGECSTCRDCGHHVCSCKPVDELMLRGRRIVAREDVRDDEAFVHDDRIEVSAKTKDSLRSILESDVRFGE